MQASAPLSESIDSLPWLVHGTLGDPVCPAMAKAGQARPRPRTVACCLRVTTVGEGSRRAAGDMDRLSVPGSRTAGTGDSFTAVLLQLQESKKPSASSLLTEIAPSRSRCTNKTTVQTVATGLNRSQKDTCPPAGSPIVDTGTVPQLPAHQRPQSAEPIPTVRRPVVLWLLRYLHDQKLTHPSSRPLKSCTCSPCVITAQVLVNVLANSRHVSKCSER